MNRPHPASAHAGYGRLYRLAAGLLSGLLVCLMLTGCGYVWRGQEGSLSENSVLGNGSKTLKIKSVEQTSLYPWLTYQVRSLVRDDINARNLAKWVDDGQADYTLTVRIPSFKVRSYGQYRSASQLYTATISIEFIVYDGKTNTEVWRSGPIYYEENYENAKEESAIKSILEMAVRRCMDALQQRHDRVSAFAYAQTGSSSASRWRSFLVPIPTRGGNGMFSGATTNCRPNSGRSSRSRGFFPRRGFW